MLLKIDSLRVHYGNVQALHGIDLHVRKGEIVTILGANGAGKSTTLMTVSGILKPSGGSVYFQDRELNRMQAHKIVEMV